MSDIVSNERQGFSSQTEIFRLTFEYVVNVIGPNKALWDITCTRAPTWQARETAKPTAKALSQCRRTTKLCKAKLRNKNTKAQHENRSEGAPCKYLASVCFCQDDLK